MPTSQKKVQAKKGAPDWLVTFADLMSILVCFFVLLISFSIQDKQKLQIVAGSMKEAFGIQPDPKRAGVIELPGSPIRDQMKIISQQETEFDTNFDTQDHDKDKKQGPEANTHNDELAHVERDLQFATAAATLRQALQNMPEISEISKNIIFEETEEGLAIQIVDQDGRSMFPQGSAEPHERTKRALEEIAFILRDLPNRITVNGHTSATQGSPRFGARGNWEISAERAVRVRQILAESGLPDSRFAGVSGRADTDPLFPDDPYLTTNRRVTVTVMKEEPPLPLGHRLVD